ncbi:MAG: hypothetical protein KGI61_03435 [Patescibacteria group bacterium]|nr:hypothetical protein [Patescibacteria group bacterium]
MLVLVAGYARTGDAERARHPFVNLSMSARQTSCPGLGACLPSHSDNEKVTVASAGRLARRGEDGVNFVTTYSLPFRPVTDVTTASIVGAFFISFFCFCCLSKTLDEKTTGFLEPGLTLSLLVLYVKIRA